jgi:hypothetical protein
MSKLAKTLQAAAGNAGGDNLYVEDVFSTYLYTGNGSTQTIENGIALGDGNYGPSVEFDGTSDYLRRSSDMTGNADGKTFTFSCWLYKKSDSSYSIYNNRNASGYGFQVFASSSTKITIYATNASGTAVLNMQNSTSEMSLYTWTHILISMDLSNASNRSVYINDVDKTSSFSFSAYSNDNIDFTQGDHFVASRLATDAKFDGRLSNVFLDYTYRDLSVEANRRLFITADGQPATGLASVNNYAYTKLAVGSQDTFPNEVFMSTDGTKFYMVGKTTDTVYQYDLSTAYDVSSATYNSVSFSVASQSTEPMGVSFSTDGTKMYIVEASNGIIYQYTLTTGFDLSTASYASKSFDTSSQRGGQEVQDVSISSDGTRLYIIVVNHIYEYTLSTAYDVSSATYNSKTYNYSSQVPAGVGMAFGNSGTKMYVMGAVSAVVTIFEYTLSTAWDVSTASYSGNSFVAAGRTNDGTGLALSSNGEYLYSVGSTGDTVFQYGMSTAYDLSTASGSSPVGSPTTPILYMPLDGSTASVGTNSGTGGDFTVNGSPTVLTEGGPYIESGYGQGGLVWAKPRSIVANNTLYDTARGVSKALISNSTASEQDYSGNGVTSFNSNGFAVTDAGPYAINDTGTTYASWTFRKQPKFFDVVTWTGNGANRTIAHNLGSVPGMIIVKRTDGSNPWAVYHRGSSPTVPEDKELQLNATDGAVNGFTTWNRTLPTDAVFSVGTEGKVNENGWQYVAYLFAHDAGGFGDDGEQNVISCGSYTTNGDGEAEVNLGWEAQFTIIKQSDGANDWRINDSMRGAPVGQTQKQLLSANTSSAESADSQGAYPTATGFAVSGHATFSNYIYIAIRRPMKTPESGTEVFMPDLSPNSNNPRFISGFPVDMAMERSRISTGVAGMDVTSRLTTGKYVRTGSTNPESGSGSLRMDYMNGFDNDGDTSPNWVAHMFRRAPGFFDVVAYTGTGGARTIAHNLQAVPQLILVKQRTASPAASPFTVYSATLGNTGVLFLNSDGGNQGPDNQWNSTTPTSQCFSIRL